MPDPTECQAVMSEIWRAAPALYLLIVIAAAALIWQWIDDWQRDKVCSRCGNCQTQIHGAPRDLPPPTSGVTG